MQGGLSLFPDANILAYINADMIILSDWVQLVRAAAQTFDHFIIIGITTA